MSPTALVALVLVTLLTFAIGAVVTIPALVSYLQNRRAAGHAAEGTPMQIFNVTYPSGLRASISASLIIAAIDSNAIHPLSRALSTAASSIQLHIQTLS